MTAVLDHLAVAAPVLTDGWELFGGVLGGSWAYGGDSPGYWWGQLEFAAGPKIELLTPTGGPDAPAGQAPGPGRGAGRLGIGPRCRGGEHIPPRTAGRHPPLVTSVTY